MFVRHVLSALISGALGGQEPASEPAGDLREALTAISESELRATVEALVACGTRNTYSETEEGPRGVGAARRWLKARLDAVAATSGGRLLVEEQWFDLPGPRRGRRGGVAGLADAAAGGAALRGANVIATLRGTREPERIYVVGGHYDSRASDTYDVASDAPGANDDASGTAVVLELARVLAAVPLDATVVFACYTGEEQGLLGSIHHAQLLAEQKAQVAGMITNDIVGNSRGDDGQSEPGFLRVFSRSTPGSDAPSRQWARFAAEAMRLHVPELAPRLVFRLDRLGRGGDHRPFDERGVPALRFSEPHEAYTRQHQDLREEGGVRYGDVLEGVDFAYLQRVARANLATLFRAAQAPASPREVRVRGSGITVDLRWEAATSADLVGYEVMRRATTAPDWEERVWSGPATRVELALSADDYLYGVRAVDRDGWRSPVAAPRD
ncbi:MAG: M28 family metallopeptidase [Planctomycetes bacterium]|nr:M28 family metallopeptidase [Planctomycetota bacterium]